jgi:hypothetical protein
LCRARAEPGPCRGVATTGVARGGEQEQEQEQERLAAVRATGLRAAQDGALDRVVGLVRRLLRVPVALVSLVDDQRQFFPGQVGPAEPWKANRATPLSHSFCRIVVASAQ